MQLDEDGEEEEREVKAEKVLLGGGPRGGEKDVHAPSPMILFAFLPINAINHGGSRQRRAADSRAVKADGQQ